MEIAGWRMEWLNGGNGGNGGQNGRMAEWQNGRTAEWQNGGMADGMVEWREWWEWRDGGRNGRMAGMTGMAGMAKRMAEWQNGRKWIHSYTYVLFTVHADDDDDNDTDDSLIFYSIEETAWISFLRTFFLFQNHP